MSDLNVESEEEDNGTPKIDPASYFEEGTFNDWIGLTVEEFGDGNVVLSVTCDEFKQNPSGILHGGVTATLIDVAGGMAIGSSLGEGPQLKATTNLNVNYLRPITNTAYATGEVVRIGRSNAVSQVEVESTAPNGERKTVAIGTATYQRFSENLK